LLIARKKTLAPDLSSFTLFGFQGTSAALVPHRFSPAAAGRHLLSYHPSSNMSTPILRFRFCLIVAAFRQTKCFCLLKQISQPAFARTHSEYGSIYQFWFSNIVKYEIGLF